MTKKRANGEGSPRPKKNGKGWESQITIGWKSDGTQDRKYFSAATKRELNQKIDEFKASLITGNYVESNKMTVEDWLKTWLETYKKNNISPKTYDSTEYHCTMHIIPSIGKIKLQSLKTEDIQKMYNTKFASGKLDGSGGLSATTVKHFHTTLKQALNKAVELGYIVKNPSVNCILPKDSLPKKLYLTSQEQDKVFKALDVSDRYELAIMLDFATGIRQGELIALTWDDVNLETEVIRINKSYSITKNRDTSIDKKYIRTIKTTKNRSSVREIPIPKYLVALLKKHKLNMIEENLAKGRSNEEYNVVFQTSTGNYLNPKNINRAWIRLLEKAQVDHVPLHGIRHSFTTRLAEMGINPKVAQVLLGHSSISTTLNIYSHVNQDLKRSAAIAIDSLYKYPNNNEVKEESGLYKCS